MVKPYYQDKWVRIYNADCLEILPQLDISPDLIITDPPYSVGVNSSGKRSSYGDNSLVKPFMHEFGNLIFKMISSNGAIYINTDWRTYPIWFDVLSQIRQLTNLIVWDYSWIKAGSHYRFSHEFIMFWAMDGHNLLDKATPDVWKIPPVNFTLGKLHPAEKPIRLIEEILIHSPGQTILDPFLGSGTTCYCAKKLNRYSIGIEIEEKYCEIAAQRCQQSVFEFKDIDNSNSNTAMELDL